MKNQFYVGLDVQVTGPFLAHHAMISIGAVIMNEQCLQVETFQVALCMPPGSRWDESWLKSYWNARSKHLANITNSALPPAEAMGLFVVWIDDMDQRYGKNLVLLSGKMSVDVSWINFYLSCFTIRPPLDFAYVQGQYVLRPIYDTPSLYHGAVMTGKKPALHIGNPWWKEDDGDVIRSASSVAANYILFLASCKQ